MSIIPRNTKVYLKSFTLPTQLEHSATELSIGYVFIPLSYVERSIKLSLIFYPFWRK